MNTNENTNTAPTADRAHEHRITVAVDRLLGDAMIIRDDRSVYCGICDRDVYRHVNDHHDPHCPVPLLERWMFGPND